MRQKCQFHQQQFSNTLLVGGVWSGHAMRMCQRARLPSPESLMYCLELPVAVIYVKRGSGCLVGTEQSGDRDHPDQAGRGYVRT